MLHRREDSWSVVNNKCCVVTFIFADDLKFIAKNIGRKQRESAIEEAILFYVTEDHT